MVNGWNKICKERPGRSLKILHNTLVACIFYLVVQKLEDPGKQWPKDLSSTPAIHLLISSSSDIYMPRSHSQPAHQSTPDGTRG